MEVVWSKSAEKELKRAFDFISLDSEINAKKIAETFVKMTLDLANHPTKHPLDKYKIITKEIGEPLKNSTSDFRIESLPLKSE